MVSFFASCNVTMRYGFFFIFVTVLLCATFAVNGDYGLHVYQDICFTNACNQGQCEKSQCILCQQCLKGEINMKFCEL